MRCRQGAKRRATGMYSEVKDNTLAAGVVYPQGAQCRRGAELRATGVYSEVHEDCERREQQSINHSCEVLNGRRIVQALALITPALVQNDSPALLSFQSTFLLLQRLFVCVCHHRARL